MVFNLEPTFLAILVTDFMAILLILSASLTAFRVLVYWKPESSDKVQLNLEIAAETSSLKVRAGSLAFFFSTILMIVAIANVLPKIVPGAMCGTGVMQATNGLGYQMIGFRMVAVLMLFMQCGLEKLDRTVPDSQLVKTNARLLLIALPAVFLSTRATLQVISGLNIQQPVDCCAAVYDAVRSLQTQSLIGTIPQIWLVGAFLTVTVFFLIFVLKMVAVSGFRNHYEMVLFGIFALSWVVLAWITLLRVFSAYHYQVLNHQCPWCLFLFEHRLVGYPLLGALALIVYESAMGLTVACIANGYPRLQAAAIVRIRQAGIWLVLGVLSFMLISGFPGILWRLRYGVWISG